jgi:hypothetical protein
MRGLAAAAIAVTTVAYGVVIWQDRALKRSDPWGHRNLQLCGKLKPGIGEADLVAAMGAPEAIETTGAVRHLTFHTLAEAAAPIRADVDAGGKVLALWCRDDARPTWSAP